MKLALVGWFAILLFVMMAGAPAANAWGCKGHQTVALIAEKQLTPEAAKMVQTLLTENPIDPALKRYCGNTTRDVMVDGSTWPDDIRGQANNGPLHYIDIPRGAKRAPMSTFCAKEGCVTKAIEDNFNTLKNPSASGAARAEALRYLIHFVGDLHQPLHATTNDDQGGNCVPVNYLRRKARKHDHSFAPNLHALWDTAIPERDMEGADPAEYAETLMDTFAAQITGWKEAGIHVDDWAWESHEFAEQIVYGKLSPKVAVEPPTEVRSCSDDSNIGDRLLAQHIVANAHYQDEAAPIAEQRIAQAGVRLALMLNEAAKAAH